jgi:hypothetical protein
LTSRSTALDQRNLRACTSFFDAEQDSKQDGVLHRLTSLSSGNRSSLIFLKRFPFTSLVSHLQHITVVLNSSTIRTSKQFAHQ